MPRESAAARKRRAARIVRRLARAYPEAQCALRFQSPFELLIATILSAQCTDEKVNEVTAVLFDRYPTAEALANASSEELETIVSHLSYGTQRQLEIGIRDLGRPPCRGGLGRARQSPRSATPGCE